VEAIGGLAAVENSAGLWVGTAPSGAGPGFFSATTSIMSRNARAGDGPNGWARLRGAWGKGHGKQPHGYGQGAGGTSGGGVMGSTPPSSPAAQLTLVPHVPLSNDPGHFSSGRASGTGAAAAVSTSADGGLGIRLSRQPPKWSVTLAQSALMQPVPDYAGGDSSEVPPPAPARVGGASDAQPLAPLTLHQSQPTQSDPALPSPAAPEESDGTLAASPFTAQGAFSRSAAPSASGVEGSTGNRRSALLSTGGGGSGLKQSLQGGAGAVDGATNAQAALTGVVPLGSSVGGVVGGSAGRLLPGRNSQPLPSRSGSLLSASGVGINEQGPARGLPFSYSGALPGRGMVDGQQEEEEGGEGDTQGGEPPLSPVSRLVQKLATATSDRGSTSGSHRGSVQYRASAPHLTTQGPTSGGGEGPQTEEGGVFGGQEDSVGGGLAPGGVSASASEGLADILRRRRLQRQEAALGIGLSEMVGGGWGPVCLMVGMSEGVAGCVRVHQLCVAACTALLLRGVQGRQTLWQLSSITLLTWCPGVRLAGEQLQMMDLLNRTPPPTPPTHAHLHRLLRR
jgi:hypothetical protein